MISIPIVASLFAPTMYGASNLVLLPCLAVLIVIAALQRELIRFRTEHLLLGLLWLVFALSTLTSPTVTIKSDTFSFLVAVIFIILVTALTYSDRELRFIGAVYVLCAIVASASVLWNVLIGHEATWHRYSTGLFGVDRDPNYVAAYIVPATFIASVASAYSPCPRHARLRGSALVILILGVVSTGSRGGLLVLALALASTLIYSARDGRARRQLLLLAVGATALGTALFPLAGTFLPDSLLERLSSSDTLFHDQARVDAWTGALGVFASRPLLGNGLNAANAYLTDEIGYGTHNVYIDILTGSGLIGSAVFVAMILLMLRGKRVDSGPLWSFALVFLAPLTFLNGFNTLNFWVPLIMISVAGQVSRTSTAPLTYIAGGRESNSTLDAEVVQRPVRSATRRKTFGVTRRHLGAPL